MNKENFLLQLGRGLEGLPKQEVKDRLVFYDEMIEDRMEEGLSEEEAVHEIGPVENVISQIIAEIPLSALIKEKISPSPKSHKQNGGVIFLLILGSPLWFPLLLAFLSVVFAIYISLWAVLISLWAVFVGITAGAAASIVGGFLLIFGLTFGLSIDPIVGQNTLTGIAFIAAGAFLAGIAIFFFFGCKALTKGFLILTGKAGSRLKKRLLRKKGKKTGPRSEKESSF